MGNCFKETKPQRSVLNKGFNTDVNHRAIMDREKFLKTVGSSFYEFLFY